MHWTLLRWWPWLDTRAQFVARIPPGGALLDLGSAEGGTLWRLHQLRPDLRLFAVDIAGEPQRYPPGCEFCRADLERQRLPWPDASMDAVTCLHLVEHLHDLGAFMSEVSRLLRPGGAVFVETPHPRSLTLPSSGGWFPLNFHDDATHVRLVSADELTREMIRAGLQPEPPRLSRNWLFAASFLGFVFLPTSRQKLTARLHWVGWSACCVARKPT
ncbi:MAG: methyltransferase domain-containing protein [Verrucomicrobiae bacterium]|nr:methyltransferase domain-containing protein [Verrucomicrobiae bacterium]MDW8309421.1 methyltransferase domain-containing protein [Verrucomicrobiales bacterium]